MIEHGIIHNAITGPRCPLLGFASTAIGLRRLAGNWNALYNRETGNNNVGGQPGIGRLRMTAKRRKLLSSCCCSGGCRICHKVDRSERGARAYNGGLGRNPCGVQGQSPWLRQGTAPEAKATSFLSIFIQKWGRKLKILTKKLSATRTVYNIDDLPLLLVIKGAAGRSTHTKRTILSSTFAHTLISHCAAGLRYRHTASETARCSQTCR